MEVPYSSLWTGIASFSPLRWHCPELLSRAELTVHRKSILDGNPCCSLSNSPVVFLCFDFWGKVAMGEGRMLLTGLRPWLPYFLGHPQVLSWTCPSQHSDQCSPWGAFILSVGPTTVHTNKNNVFNGVPGLKVVWILCRNVFNSLSQAEGLSLQKCLQGKYC